MHLAKDETLVALYVVGDSRRFLSDRPRGQGFSFQRTLARREMRPDCGHGRLVVTRPGHRNKPVLVGIYHCYPSHFEFAMLDRSLASAVEQRRAVTYSHHRGTYAGDHCVQAIEVLEPVFRSLAFGSVACPLPTGEDSDQQCQRASHDQGDLRLTITVRGR